MFKAICKTGLRCLRGISIPKPNVASRSLCLAPAAGSTDPCLQLVESRLCFLACTEVFWSPLMTSPAVKLEARLSSGQGLPKIQSNRLPEDTSTHGRTCLPLPPFFLPKLILVEGLQTISLDVFWSCVLCTFLGGGEGQPSIWTLKVMVKLDGSLWTGETIGPVSHL